MSSFCELGIAASTFVATVISSKSKQHTRVMVGFVCKSLPGPGRQKAGCYVIKQLVPARLRLRCLFSCRLLAGAATWKFCRPCMRARASNNWAGPAPAWGMLPEWTGASSVFLGLVGVRRRLSPVERPSNTCLASCCAWNVACCVRCGLGAWPRLGEGAWGGISDGKSDLPENLPLPVVSEKRIPAKFRIFRFQNSKIQKNS